MSKDFYEALSDGFSHITSITDKQTLDTLRSEGIRIDDEGYYSYGFGQNNSEYELCIEPIHEEGVYLVALYKNRVLLTEKLLIRANSHDK